MCIVGLYRAPRPANSHPPCARIASVHGAAQGITLDEPCHGGVLMPIRWKPLSFSSLVMLAICGAPPGAGAEAAPADQWTNAAHDDAGTFHSALKDINAANVK